MSLNAHRYWFNRFEARPLADGGYAFRDWLQAAGRTLGPAVFDGLQGRALEVAFFQHGFASAAVSAIGTEVAHDHLGLADASSALFWQYPCRTEADAWEVHAPLSTPLLKDGALHIYLGLPWATWIDKGRKAAWGEGGTVVMQHQVQRLSVQFSGLRHALAALGLRLKLHTVCQHIEWRDMLPVWQRLGVTDLWLSHRPTAARLSAGLGEIDLHPWALYAVNVEDPHRRAGLSLGQDPATKSVLASFLGAHMPHYLSDARLQLRALANEPGFVVRVTDQWHFEAVVYQHQIAGGVLEHSAHLRTALQSYNQLLSDSVFALCPSGAGPNTLRLWEALAVGAVPVLLGVQPVLPTGGSLPAIDWERIVLRVPEGEISRLPQLLQAVPLSERRERQQLGLQAYTQVKAQRCF